MTAKQIEHIITMAEVELEMNGIVSETTSKLMLKALKYTTKYDMSQNGKKNKKNTTKSCI